MRESSNMVSYSLRMRHFNPSATVPTLTLLFCYRLQIEILFLNKFSPAQNKGRITKQSVSNRLEIYEQNVQHSKTNWFTAIG
jgi:hypothetical protein